MLLVAQVFHQEVQLASYQKWFIYTYVDQT